MKKSGIILLFFLLVALGCDKEDRYVFTIKNNTNITIGYYLAIVESYGGSEYPDTLLPSTGYLVTREIKPFDKIFVGDNPAPWDDMLSSQLSSDTLSVFFFDADTLHAYAWEEIQQDYKILARYDLSIEDLKRMDFTITYPLIGR